MIRQRKRLGLFKLVAWGGAAVRWVSLVRHLAGGLGGVRLLFRGMVRARLAGCRFKVKPVGCVVFRVRLNANRRVLMRLMLPGWLGLTGLMAGLMLGLIGVMGGG
jgi:hypothetical protein